MEEGRRVTVGGPYFEDLERGQVFDAPGLTLTWGHAAIHQAIAGDRLLLPLDAPLSRAVTGSRGRTGPPEPGLRRGDRAVDRADPAGARQPLLPRPRPAAPGLSRRHPAHPDRGRRAEAEPGARRRQRLGARGAADPDRQPARRAGARLLSLPDDPAPRPERRNRARRRLRRDLQASSTPSGFGRRSRDWDYAAMRTRVGDRAAALEPGTVYAIEGRETVTTRARAGAADAERRDDASRRRRRGARAPARLRRPDDLDRRRARRARAARAGDDRRLAKLSSTPRPSSRATC